MTRPGAHGLVTVCGTLMHSSLAITSEGRPPGLAAVKFWTRKKFKGAAALRKQVRPTRVPIEEKGSILWVENLKQSTRFFDDPGRCVHNGDRESDIYELFCTAHGTGTHVLIGTYVDRPAGEGEHMIAYGMDEVTMKRPRRIEVRDSKGDQDEAILEIKSRRIRVRPQLVNTSVMRLNSRGRPFYVGLEQPRLGASVALGRSPQQFSAQIHTRTSKTQITAITLQ